MWFCECKIIKVESTQKTAERRRMADDGIVSVVLRRNDEEGFGFSLLQLGSNSTNHIIYDILENSPAAESGEVSSIYFTFTVQNPFNGERKTPTIQTQQQRKILFFAFSFSPNHLNFFDVASSSSSSLAATSFITIDHDIIVVSFLHSLSRIAMMSDVFPFG